MKSRKSRINFKLFCFNFRGLPICYKDRCFKIESREVHCSGNLKQEEKKIDTRIKGSEEEYEWDI